MNLHNKINVVLNAARLTPAWQVDDKVMRYVYDLTRAKNKSYDNALRQASAAARALWVMPFEVERELCTVENAGWPEDSTLRRCQRTESILLFYQGSMRAREFSSEPSRNCTRSHIDQNQSMDPQQMEPNILCKLYREFNRTIFNEMPSSLQYGSWTSYPEVQNALSRHKRRHGWIFRATVYIWLIP